MKEEKREWVDVFYAESSGCCARTFKMISGAFRRHDVVGHSHATTHMRYMCTSDYRATGTSIYSSLLIHTSLCR
jgi:hypothetical protein